MQRSNHVSIVLSPWPSSCIMHVSCSHLTQPPAQKNAEFYEAPWCPESIQQFSSTNCTFAGRDKPSSQSQCREEAELGLKPYRIALKQIPGKNTENTAKYPGDDDPGQQLPTSNLDPPYGYSHLVHIYLQITDAFCPSSRAFINYWQWGWKKIIF